MQDLKVLLAFTAYIGPKENNLEGNREKGGTVNYYIHYFGVSRSDEHRKEIKISKIKNCRFCFFLT